MNTYFKHVIPAVFRCGSLLGNTTLIQELWTVTVRSCGWNRQGGPCQSIVVKHIQTKATGRPPPGLEYRHRALSRQAENRTRSKPPGMNATVQPAKPGYPRCLAVAHHNDDVLIVLERPQLQRVIPCESHGSGGPKSTGFCSGLHSFTPALWVSLRMDYGSRAPTGI